MERLALSFIEQMSEEELNNLCFHLTFMSSMDQIDANGLGARKGFNSSGELGREKTAKVFFSKGYTQTLAMVNRAMDIINRALSTGDVELITKFGLDPNMDVMSNIAQLLDKMIYYVLNIKGVSKKEYETLSEEEKARISYLTDDLDEETGKVMEDANMHTISGVGVPETSLVKVFGDNGEVVSSLEIIKALCKRFKELHPDMQLPTRHQSVNHLENFYNEVILNEVNQRAI